MKSGGEGGDDWADDTLNDLWCEFIENNTAESEDPYLSGDYLYRFIGELLESSGGEPYPGLIEDGGSPGCSSSLHVIFAENPKGVIEDSKTSLKELLLYSDS